MINLNICAFTATKIRKLAKCFFVHAFLNLAQEILYLRLLQIRSTLHPACHFVFGPQCCVISPMVFISPGFDGGVGIDFTCDALKEMQLDVLNWRKHNGKAKDSASYRIYVCSAFGA